MSNICSTCKFNGGCLGDVRKFFKLEYTATPGWPDELILCKHGNESHDVLPTLPREKCSYWEVCNDGYYRQTS